MKSGGGLLKKTGLSSTTTTKRLVKKKSIKQSSEVGRSLKPKPKKRLKLEQKSAQQLIGYADKEYSRYIRLRDSALVDGEWWGECISCDKRKLVRDRDGKWTKGMENGHFISRGVHQLRFDEENTNLQCSHCNAWRDKEDMLEAYRAALAYKYGDNVPKDLKKRSKAEGALKRLTKPELLQVIHDSKLQVELYLKEI